MIESWGAIVAAKIVQGMTDIEFRGYRIRVKGHEVYIRHGKKAYYTPIWGLAKFLAREQIKTQRGQ